MFEVNAMSIFFFKKYVETTQPIRGQEMAEILQSVRAWLF